MGGVNVIEGNTAVNCDLMELGLHDAGPPPEAHRGVFWYKPGLCFVSYAY